MLPISSNAIIEKNKINSNEKWLLLLEINYENELPIYLCLNSQSITWNSNEYLPAIFNLSGIVETKDGEVPSIPLTIFDLNRTLIPLLEAYDGGIGAEVIIRVVHSKYLSNVVPEFEESTEIIDVSVDDTAKVQFKLGSENLQNRRIPPNRFFKNACRFKFKRTTLHFNSGSTLPVVGNYLKGDTSGDRALIVEVKLYSGVWGTGDAAGQIVVDTVEGGFQVETVSTYSDINCTVLVQSNALSGIRVSESPSYYNVCVGKCKYVGTEVQCDRTYFRCKELSNDRNFGGFPSVGRKGLLK